MCRCFLYIHRIMLCLQETRSRDLPLSQEIRRNSGVRHGEYLALPHLTPEQHTFTASTTTPIDNPTLCARYSDSSSAPSSSTLRRLGQSSRPRPSAQLRPSSTSHLNHHSCHPPKTPPTSHSPTSSPRTPPSPSSPPSPARPPP